MTLEQVQAARPTLDFDGRYAVADGPAAIATVRRGGLSQPEGGATMKRHALGLLLVTVAALGATVSAHHSYSATYDVRQEVTVDGTLVQFVYRNPHSFVHMQAPDAAV
jgi:hypothetical protein